MAATVGSPANLADTPAEQNSLCGDVLESVVSRVPTAFLVPASRVCKEWRSAVRATVRGRLHGPPWLLLLVLRGHLRPASASMHAYDPATGAWLRFVPGPGAAGELQFTRCPEGDRLCSLSLTALAVAEDALGARWREGPSPRVWRDDAAVAEVAGVTVVVAGGFEMALEEGEEVGAVEVGRRVGWEMAPPLPEGFCTLTAASAGKRLSVAASGRRVYVVEKMTGVASWFDPKSLAWAPTKMLQPNDGASRWAIAYAGTGERLLVFLLKKLPSAAAVTVVEADGEQFEIEGDHEGDAMPKEMAERLFPEREETAAMWYPWSLGVSGGAAGGYVFNETEPANGVVLYELSSPQAAAGGRTKGEAVVRRWEWVPCPPAMGLGFADRVVAGCSPVGFEDLAAAQPLT